MAPSSHSIEPSKYKQKSDLLPTLFDQIKPFSPTLVVVWTCQKTSKSTHSIYFGTFRTNPRLLPSLKSIPSNLELTCSVNHLLPFTFRFLIPSDFQAIQFLQIIRKRMQLGKETAITLFVNNKKILTSDSMMSEVYQRDKATDGFLYITFKEGEHFG